ncbi:MAG: hypothetical protein C0490_21415 [Marivirga sp.]|nr:hypothetical protein [Marivirga sp.]
MKETLTYGNLYQEELYALRSKVLVVLSSDWASVQESDQLLLGKILGSVKLNLASVQIISQKEFELGNLVTYNPSHIIAFGSSLKGISNTYELLSIQEIPIILADELQKLDDAKKKSLWGALRQMFKL